MITDFNFGGRYVVILNNIIPGLLTDGNYLIGILTCVSEFSIIDLYVNSIILFRETFMDKVMNGYYGFNVGSLYAKRDLMT